MHDVFGRIRLLALALVLTSVPSALAGPFALSYSGRLIAESGRPVDGPVDLTVSLFDDATTTTPINVTIPPFLGTALSSGVFQLTLALSVADFHKAFDGTGDVWIEVKDTTNGRTYPRQRFFSVPYALKIPVDDLTVKFGSNGNLQIKTDNAVAAGKVLKVTPGGELTWGDDLVGGVGSVSNADLQADVVTSDKIADGTIVAADISSVDDAALSANVTKLGSSIDLATEVTGTLADASLSANITKLGSSIDLASEVTGTLADASLSANVTKLGSDVDLSNAETTGTLPVGKGGTGATTLTGVLKGNGTGAFTVATASDIPAQSYLASPDGTPAQAVYVDANGNVGIGTTSPAANFRLSVVNSGIGGIASTVASNSTNVTSNGGRVLSLSNSDTTAGNNVVTSYYDANNHLQGGIGMKFGDHSAMNQGDFFIEPKIVATPSTFVVTAAGNIGVGTSSPNVASFVRAVTVNSPVAGNGAFELAQNGAFMGSFDNLPDGSGMNLRVASGKDLLIIGGNGEAARFLGSNNSLGIGTAAPNERLEVASTLGARVLFSDSGGASRKGILFEAPLTGRMYGRIEAYDYGAPSGLPLVLNSTGGGNVGIGTTIPTAKLEVAGVAGTDGIKFPDGTLQTTAVKALPGSISYYVRTDGSDANNGLANTSGGAFLTIQKAVDTARAQIVNNVNISIYVADGTYTAGAAIVRPTLGNGPISIIGNTTTPGNVIVNSSGTAFYVANRAELSISGVEVRSATGYGIYTEQGGLVYLGAMRFGTCFGPHMLANSYGEINLTSDYTIAGDAQSHLHAENHGMIVDVSRTVTVSGTPAFFSFAVVAVNGVIRVDATTFSGAATGIRYSSQANGTIYGTVAAPNFFPGNAAGSTSTGGQYQ